MTDSVTFRQLELADNNQCNPDTNMSSLEEWYCRIRDIPIDSFDTEDLCRACRQKMYVDYVVPAALACLEEDPLAGELYDGELLVAMKSIPYRYWMENDESAARLIRVARRAKQFSKGEEIIEDIEWLVDRIGRRFNS
jgi:CDI immunity proteins